jgi:uncharacterized protein with GYD domain
VGTYVILVNLTDQGVRTAKDTTKRAAAAKEAATKFGIRWTSVVWTIGNYDMVVTMEAPNDEAVMAFSVAVASAGNVRTQTLRAFNSDEMNGILAKLG